MSLIGSLRGRVVSYLDGLSRMGGTSYATPVMQVGNPNASSQRDLYDLLRAIYFGSGVYAELARQRHAGDEHWASVKELRMLAHAVVEAYVALVMPGPLPGALPITYVKDPHPLAENVTGQIHQVWHWSNWGQKKQLYIRQLAMLGNAYIYVASRPGPDGERADRVYFHLPEPEHVTDIDTDERGFLTYYRSDVPVRERDDPDHPVVVTEEWWKARDLYRRWVTPTAEYDPNRLGTPERDEKMKGTFGIDFVPVVHAKAVDTGDTYGMAPHLPALEKQHEVNRKATAFSQQLYRHGKPDKVIQGAGGQTAGAYSPPPPINQATATQQIEVAGETLWTLPPGWTIENMIANLPYDAHMAGIDQDIAHLAATDLPELNWYRLAQSGNDASGRALQTLLKPAIARIEEARGNAETALARADAMALTIGQFAELPGFEVARIGTYENGDFEHTFQSRPIVPADEQEQVEVLKARTEIAGRLMSEAAMDAAGALRLAGFTERQIADGLAAIEAAASTGIER